LDSEECQHTFIGHTSYITSVAFHPDGNTFISGLNDFTIKAWDLNTGACLATFDKHSFPISGLAFHPDGKFFISSSHDSTIKVWEY
jgi:WD40 repeat protein